MSLLEQYTPTPPAVELEPLLASPQALGREAVNLYLGQVKIDDKEIATGIDIAPVQIAQDAASLAIQAQEKLSRQSKDFSEFLAARLSLHLMPLSLQRMVNGYDTSARTGNTALFNHLISKDNDGNFNVSPKTALNVFEWHNRRLSSKQEAFEINTVTPAKKAYAEKVHHAVKSGWLPPVALERLSRLDRTAVYVDDGTSTHAEGKAGYVTSLLDGTYTVVMDLSTELRTYDHEFTHVLSGKTPRPNALLQPHISPENIGLARLADKSHVGFKLLNEAVIEVTRVNLGRDHIAKNVSTNSKYLGASYPQGRELLDTLSQKGIKPISLELFIAATFEDGTEQEQLGNDSCMSQLRTAIEESFPDTDIFGAIAAIGNSQNDAEKDIKILRGNLTRTYRKKRLGNRILKNLTRW